MTRSFITVLGLLTILATASAKELLFSVDQLLLDGVVGVVEILPGSGAETRVDVLEPSDFKGRLKLETVGATLRIKGLSSRSGHSSQISTGSIVNIAEGPGSVSVVNIGGNGVSANDPPIRLSIALARGRDVEFQGLVGDVTIGSIDGALRGEASGAYRIRAQGIRGIFLRMTGSGTLEIEKIQGDVQLQAEGSSETVIRQGDIGNLSIVASGASVIRIAPLARTAKVEASGASEVFLRQGAGPPPQLKQSGAAEIRVGSW
ncbi:hypothetical protein CCP4SC76_2140005 [Gammaproteobacteria bacterium]